MDPRLEISSLPNHFEISMPQVQKRTLQTNEKNWQTSFLCIKQTASAGVEPRTLVLTLSKGLHTPVQSVSWPIPKPGPRIGDFIPPRSL
ncbi:unnamed protein product [Staurois parvus]|uniref:Uncharacterized protein n=1 Tax=Staurois parvus TaxID=386267 RepID=A0ABN9DMK4_9NEOB|nr:unnamed protein product [Staurois parvus]